MKSFKRDTQKKNCIAQDRKTVIIWIHTDDVLVIVSFCPFGSKSRQNKIKWINFEELSRSGCRARVIVFQFFAVQFELSTNFLKITQYLNKHRYTFSQNRQPNWHTLINKKPFVFASLLKITFVFWRRKNVVAPMNNCRKKAHAIYHWIYVGATHWQLYRILMQQPTRP